MNHDKQTISEARANFSNTDSEDCNARHEQTR